MLLVYLGEELILAVDKFLWNLLKAYKIVPLKDKR